MPLNKREILLFALLIALSIHLARAQQPTPVTITNSSQVPITILEFYDSSDNLQYVCRAPLVATYSWSVTAAAGNGGLTSIVVATNVGTVTTTANHGLQIGNVITVSGSTTAALNASYQIATVPSATTFTVATSGVSDATYNTAALKVSTNAPRSNASHWSIAKYSYYGVSGASCPVGVSGPVNKMCSGQWATNLSSGQGGSFAYIFSCDSRATQSYQ